MIVVISSTKRIPLGSQVPINFLRLKSKVSTWFDPKINIVYSVVYSQCKLTSLDYVLQQLSSDMLIVNKNDTVAFYKIRISTELSTYFLPLKKGSLQIRIIISFIYVKNNKYTTCLLSY